MMIGGFMGLLKAVVVKKVGGMVMGKLFGAAAKDGGKNIPKTDTQAATDALKSQVPFMERAKEFFKALGDIPAKDIGMATVKAVLIAGFMAVAFVGLALAIGAAVAAFNQYGFTAEQVGVAVLAIVGGAMGAALVAKTMDMMGKVDWKKAATGLLAVGLVVLALTVFAPKIGDMIASMPEIPTSKLVSFFAVIGLSLLSAAVAMLVAWPAAQLAEKFGLYIVAGLAILGVVMYGLGWLGVKIGKMVEKGVSNPQKVGFFMNAITKLMLATALMLPVAGALGIMLMAWPFGTAGIAIIMLGFGVLGKMAASIVKSLMPAIKEIAKIKLENPEHFKMITEALVALIKGVTAFASAIGGIMKTLKPTSWGRRQGETMEGNINAASGFVDALLKGGINVMIEKMIELATASKINKDGVEAIKAIASMVSAVADILKAMQPDPKVIESITGMAGWWSGSGGAIKMMDKLNEYMKVARCSAEKILKTVVNTFFKKEFLALFNGVDPNAAKVIGAFGPVLTGVAEVLKTMTPTDEMMKTVQEADAWWSRGRAQEMMDKMTNHMKAMEAPIKGILEGVGTSLSTIMKSIGTIIRDIGNLSVDPKAMESIANIITAVMDAMGNMMAGIGPAVQTAGKIAGKFSNASAVMRYQLENIGKMAGTMAKSFAEQMPAISKMIKEMVKVAATISDPKKAAEQTKVIVDLFKVIETLSDIFGGKDATMSAYSSKASGRGFSNTTIGALAHNMTQFNKAILKSGGPLEEFVKKITGLNVPKGAEKKAKQIGTVMCALGVIMKGVEQFKSMAAAGSTAGNNDSSALAEINQAVTRLKLIKFEDLEAMMLKIAKIKYVNPKVIKNRSDAFKHLATALDGFYDVGRNKPPSTTYFSQNEQKVKDWAGTVSSMTGHITSKMKNRLVSTAKLIKQMVADYNEINKLLYSTKPLNLSANIDKFGKNLQLDTQTVQVKNKPINITCMISLTMNASDMSLGLAKRGGKHVVALSAGGKTNHTKHPSMWDADGQHPKPE